MNWPPPVRMVGVGSSSGDDAAGWVAVNVLRQAKAWPSDFEFYAIDGGQRLLDLLDGRGTLIVLDAFGTDSEPGAILRLEWPDPKIESLGPGSTHHFRPAETLQLASALKVLPSRVVIWAIGGSRFDPQSGLSPAVAAAIPALARRVIADLQE